MKQYMANTSKCPGIFVSQRLLSACLHLPFSIHTARTHYRLAAATTGTLKLPFQGLAETSFHEMQTVLIF